MGNKTRASIIVHRSLFIVPLFIVSLLLLWPVVRHPGWWIWKPGAEHSDLAVTHWPNAHFTRQALWNEGRFPLWRPAIMSGTPFAANPLAGLYYPPNWFFLFLPWLSLEAGVNLSMWVHLWLAGAAMYALMRRGLGAGRWGALVAAIVYEASPKLLAHLGAGHVGWVQAWGWLPVVVLCWLKALQDAGCRMQDTECRMQKTGGERPSSILHSPFSILHSPFSILAGIALAIQFCADVRMAAYTLAACLWLLLVRYLPSAIRHSSFAIRYSPFAIRHSPSAIRHSPFAIRHSPFAIRHSPFAIFLGLSACQWLPLVALLPATTRAQMTMHDAAVWSLPWRYLVGLLLANHGGFHEWMTYVGVSTLVLAGVGGCALWRKREERWRVGWLVSLLVGAVWFSLGENGGLFQVLWRIVPGLGLLRVPPRAWGLVVFAMAVLAGSGVEEAGSREQEARGRKQEAGDVGQRSRVWRLVSRWLKLTAASFPPMLVVGYWLLVGVPPLNLVMFGLISSLTIALCSLPISNLQSLSSILHPPFTILHSPFAVRHSPFAIRHSPFAGLAAVLLVAADLLVVDATLVEARPPEEVFAEGRAAAVWLAAQPGPFRVYSPSYSIPQHVAELYGLALADGVDPLQLRAYADYLTRAAGLEPQGYSVTLPPFLEGTDVRTALKDVVPDAEALGRLGVRYVAAAFPIANRKLQWMGQFEGVYVYRNEATGPVVDAGPDGGIVLSDGTTLFRYHRWPVYAGWAVSGVTVVGLLVSWLVGFIKAKRR